MYEDKLGPRPHHPPREVERICCVCFVPFVGNPMRRICKGCRPMATAVSRMACALVWLEIRNGIIPDPVKLICVDCGAKAALYEHRDYCRPLSVEAVCCICNRARGQAKFPPAGSFTKFDMKRYREFVGLPPARRALDRA